MGGEQGEVGVQRFSCVVEGGGDAGDLGGVLGTGERLEDGLDQAAVAGAAGLVARAEQFAGLGHGLELRAGERLGEGGPRRHVLGELRQRLAVVEDGVGVGPGAQADELLPARFEPGEQFDQVQLPRARRGGARGGERGRGRGGGGRRGHQVRRSYGHGEHSGG